MSAVPPTRARWPALAARSLPSPGATARRLAARHPALGGFALFAAIAAACRPASFRTGLGRDTGAYLYVGDVILHGGTPYLDAANNKGPVTYLLFAAIDAVGGTSVVFVRLVLVGFVALAALALAGYVATFAGRAAGLLAGVTLAALAATEPLQGDDPNTEQIGIAPMAGAWWLATRPDRRAAAASGVLVAAAAAMNPALALVAPFVAFELWRSRPEDRAARLGAAAAGAAVVLVGLAVWLWASGAMPVAWEQLGRQTIGAVSEASAGGRVLTAPTGAQPVTDVPAAGLWLAGIVGCLIALRDARLRRIAVPALAWIVLSWARVKLASYEYPHHYVPVLIGMAAGIAVGLAALWRPDTRSRLALGGLVLAMPLWTYVLEPQWKALAVPPDQRTVAFEPTGNVYPVAEFIREHTRPSDRISVAGSEAQVYWLSGRRAPTRYFDSYSFGYRPGAKAARARDLRAHPPRAVAALNSDPLDPVLAGLVSGGGYRIAFELPGTHVWLRDP